jgi:glycosyltransferase involved in cell wall biosynthesis
MTSVQEGMPVSALEAACCGLPIFSTRCGGVEDYVDDSMGRIHGIVDAEGFAQSLKAYLEGELVYDPAHIRQSVVSRFGRAAFTDNMSAVFNSVIQG